MPLAYVRPDVPLSLSQALSADDPACWTVGVERIASQLTDKVVKGTYLEDDRARERLVEIRRTPGDILKPHLPLLARIIENGAQPPLEAEICRLIGHAREKQYAHALRPLLSHNDARVQDSVAVALGLLGERSGYERLKLILQREVPERKERTRAYRTHDRLELDAILALAILGDDASVDTLGTVLMEDLHGLRVVINEKGRKSLIGRARRAQRITRVIPWIENPRSAVWLLRSQGYLEKHPEIAGPFDQEGIARSLQHFFEEYGHATISEQLRKSNPAD
jgi:hypothetical protein